MKFKKKQDFFHICMAVLLTIIAIIMIVCIGPKDVFTHGNYCDVVEPSNIEKEDFVGEVDLSKGKCEGEFIPQKNNFNGLQLWFANISPNDKGSISVSVTDSRGKILDRQYIDTKRVTKKSWYNVYIDAKLEAGLVYKYIIEAKNCDIYPKLQMVQKSYLGKENVDGKILIGYTYAEPTFSIAEKIIISVLISAVWVLCIGNLLFSNRTLKYLNIIGGILLFTVILSWNYMFSTFNSANDGFKYFEAQSETLVTGVIEAEQNSVKSNISGPYSFGLGRYTDLKGDHTAELFFRTDSNWNEGYSRTEPQLLISDTVLAEENVVPGNTIKFSNGEKIKIEKVNKTENYLIVTLKTDKILNPYKNGNLLKVKFYNKNGKELPTRKLEAYTSQYGLQGKIFRHLARYLDVNRYLEIFHTLCAMAAALVFTIIIFLINKKYGRLMAACFGFTFLLSPWVVNFARNLYWMEFLWFIPMAIGLFCAIHIKDMKYRVSCYLLMFFAILIKCLCSYEYITDIMLASVVWLLADMINDIIKNKKDNKLFLYFRTIFALGCVELAGFFSAICIHAQVHGQGNLILGIKNIIETVRIRTLGGNLNSSIIEDIKESFNVSGWEVFRTYFHFNTEIVHSEIISGIAGELFPLLCIIPIIIFIYNYKKEKIDWNVAALYVLLFITCTSWYILGKQHSYCHRHLNYVLWYFGYIQICFYIILREIITFFNKGKGVKE